MTVGSKAFTEGVILSELYALALEDAGIKVERSFEISGSLSGTVTVGSKAFTEGVILSELYALALEDAGIKVERSFEISGSLIHTALENGDIDLYPEYTGTGLISVLKMNPMTDPEEVYQTVKDEYATRFDLVWLDKSEAADGQGLVIRTAAGERLGIKTISDLQQHASDLRFASQGQFDERADGLPALEAAYGAFDWKDSAIYDEGLKYEVLRNDEADVTPAYTTEAQLTDKTFSGGRPGPGHPHRGGRATRDQDDLRPAAARLRPALCEPGSIRRARRRTPRARGRLRSLRLEGLGHLR